MLPFLLEALGAPTPLPRSPAFGQDNAAAQLYAVTITQNFHPPVTHALEKINDDGTRTAIGNWSGGAIGQATGAVDDAAGLLYMITAGSTDPVVQLAT